jgi:16S rRNA processing protein RimM
MNRSDTRLIGTLAKLHSFKGRFVLISETGLSEEIENWESVFLEIEGLLVPFFIDFTNITSGSSAIIGFEDVGSSEKAKDFVSCKVYQLASLIEEVDEEDTFSDQLSGYRVIDKNAGYIGTIDKILDYNQNLILRILKDKDEILIPLNENIISKINHKKKEVSINAPEGLLNLNK